MIKDKKADMQWSVLVYFILGLVVIFIVVMGVIGPSANFAKKKFFNEESGQWKWPWSPQGNFTPYNPDEHLNMNEIIVQDSVKALQCAINSQAVGAFDYTKTDVCPAGYVKKDNDIYYGFSKVSCSGISSRLLSFEGKNENQAIQLLGDAVEECYKNSKNVDLEYKYTKCAYYDPGEPNAGIAKSVTQDKIKLYLQNKNTEDSKNASNMLGKWTNRVKTDEVKLGSEGCIYYNKNYADTVDIKDCDVDNPTDYFNCYISNFTLPQNLTTAQEWIPAFGDPEYLVYYEKFPESAAAYWQKSWMDLVSYSTLGYIGGFGLLNMVGLGGTSKVAKQVAKEGIEQAGKEAIEKTVKEAATQGSAYLIQRAAKSNLKNVIRTLVIEEESQKLFGIGVKTAKEIGDKVSERLGKEAGKEAFEKVEKELTEDVFNVLTQNSIRRPEFYTKTVEEYRRELAEIIIKGGKNLEGTTVRGAKEVFENQLTKAVTKELLEKQSYKVFFQKLFKEGTEEIDQKLLDEAAEKSFARLANLNKINPAYVEKGLAVGAEKVGRLLLQGTTGIAEGDSFWVKIGKQLPIKWNSKTLLGKTAFGIPEWVINHPLPSAVFLSILIDGADSTNEKYVPVGVNTLAVTQPSLLSQKKTFDFNSLTEKYFIKNQIKEGSPLYLVSPCVANLKIVKRKCTCANNPTDQTFNFGGGVINVEPWSVQLKDVEQRKEFYKQEWAKLSQSTKDLYKDEAHFINYSANLDESKFLDNVVKGSVPSTGVKLTYDKQMYDSSEAVKICNDRTIIGDVFHAGKTFGYGWLDAYYQGTGWEPTEKEWDNLYNSNIDYKSECIEIEPERVYGYCYDYFPKTEWVRTGVMVGTLILDVAIIAVSGGTAAPIVFFGTGVLGTAVDLILESSEKWPQGNLAWFKDSWWVKYFV